MKALQEHGHVNGGGRGRTIAIDFVPNRLGLAVFHISKAVLAAGAATVISTLAAQYSFDQVQKAWALRKAE